MSTMDGKNLVTENGLLTLWAREHCLSSRMISTPFDPSDGPQLSWCHDEDEQHLQAQTLCFDFPEGDRHLEIPPQFAQSQLGHFGMPVCLG